MWFSSPSLSRSQFCLMSSRPAHRKDLVRQNTGGDSNGPTHKIYGLNQKIIGKRLCIPYISGPGALREMLVSWTGGRGRQ
jgi:hypothetical protein